MHVTISCLDGHPRKFIHEKLQNDQTSIYGSLALPDPLRTGAYQLEIINVALQGSGTVHSHEMFDSLLVTVASKVRLTFGLIPSDAESAINTKEFKTLLT